MALASRIVLFHDLTPQGRRDAEVLGAGLGLLPGYVFLPDAQHRLRQRDRLRISLLSRRFAPDACVTLDSGTLLQVSGDDPLPGNARQLHSNGTIDTLRAA
jgi:hypothetical protein